MMTYVANKKFAEFMGLDTIEVPNLSDQYFSDHIKYAKSNITMSPPWNKGLTGQQVAWNKGLVGNKLSEETKEKMKRSQTGKTLSEGHKEKIGISNSISKKGSIPWNKGKILSDNQKRKYEFIITCPIGTKYRVNSLTDYCKEHGLILSKMSSVSTGKLNHHRGYTVERIK